MFKKDGKKTMKNGGKRVCQLCIQISTQFIHTVNTSFFVIFFAEITKNISILLKIVIISIIFQKNSQIKNNKNNKVRLHFARRTLLFHWENLNAH